MIIYLALGSNIGDRSCYLRRAIQALTPQVEVVSCSPIYETPPWGIVDQPRFLNQAVKAKTELKPRPLLNYLKRIEHNLGRVKTSLYGPRVIDLDILFYGDLVYQGKLLTIPHPRLHERAFVLVPLANIAPDLCHPVFGKDITQLLMQVNTDGILFYSGD